ncbi:hypothetical protein BD413DRAFT_681317 [Trametes elegans]|nr:hypothetical protein BD413DRAFT_681317 [Trametes elegans]
MHPALQRADVLSRLFMILVEEVEDADVELSEKIELKAAVRSTLCRCALVCRTFTDPALTTLWQQSAFNPNDNTLYLLKGELSRNEWERFRHYTKRVRILNFPKHPWNSGAPLLPGLKELTWLPASPTDISGLPLPDNLECPSVLRQRKRPRSCSHLTTLHVHDAFFTAKHLRSIVTNARVLESIRREWPPLPERIKHCEGAGDVRRRAVQTKGADMAQAYDGPVGLLWDEQKLAHARARGVHAEHLHTLAHDYSWVPNTVHPEVGYWIQVTWRKVRFTSFDGD